MSSIDSSRMQDAVARAISAHQQGQLGDAEALYKSVLALDPDQFESLHFLGLIEAQRGNFHEADRLIARSLQVNSSRAEAFVNHARVLNSLKRSREALASCDKALQLQPGLLPALISRGNALHDLQRDEEALESYDLALKINPNLPDNWVNRGTALHSLERYAEALTCFDKALAANPNHARAWTNRGATLLKLLHREEALANFDRALSLDPGFADNWLNRGTALDSLHRQAEAVSSFDKALAIDPNHPRALSNRGAVLVKLSRYEEALANLDRALGLDPGLADALYNRAEVLKRMRRLDEALTGYERARAVDPDHQCASGILDVVSALCDWRRTEVIAEDVIRRVRQSDRSVVGPFALLGIRDEPALHLQCATKFIRDKLPIRPTPLWNGAVVRHDRIRVAYLSADFQAHPTAYLMAELFERHDRSRFEVMGVSFGPDDGSEMRGRLKRAFDEFVDMRGESDRDVAGLLHGREVDIAVDLMGYTNESRPEILGVRPAPIQVNYLGYPGTMGADFIDYVIADPIVLPFDQQPFYTEKIVHLPDCYQPNDTQRKIAEPTPSRRDAGLPEQGFVFCCFNNNYKITEPVFSVWMRLLAAIPGSVLWLLRDNAGAEQNLRHEARTRGIGADRLVFADRQRLDEHLARHRCADLFLDTLPYNAHTTASDALWAGLPLVTCKGRAFAGRVAASLLQAVGLPELVTETLADYEALALRLASDPKLLAEIRAKLARGRRTQPLFDIDRFRRHIESAYATMWETWQRGEPPRSFSVAALGTRA